MKITTIIRYFQKNALINQLKNNYKVWCDIFYNIIMMRFGEKEITKETFYAAKRPMKIQDVNVDNMVILRLFKTKTNSKYLIGFLDKAIITLVLIMPEMIGYVKIFNIKDEMN